MIIACAVASIVIIVSVSSVLYDVSGLVVSGGAIVYGWSVIFVVGAGVVVAVVISSDSGGAGVTGFVAADSALVVLTVVDVVFAVDVAAFCVNVTAHAGA